MSLHHSVRAKDQKHAEHRLRKAGGSIVEPIEKAIKQHENHDHKGEKHTKLKLARGGGIVHGSHPMPRLDKRARGGRTGKGPEEVNVIVHTGSSPAEKQVAMQQGMKMGAAMAAPKPMMPPPGAGGPPPGGPMMGAPPPGIGGGMPPRPPGLKRGGPVKLTASAAGASGRLQKNNDYGNGEKVKVKGYVRRKAGGRVKEEC